MTAVWISLALLISVLVFWFWRTGAGKEPSGVAVAEAPHPLADAGDEPEDFASKMGTVVLLVDNDWNACTVDGLKEDWKRHAAADVRGFAGIGGGRHQAVTTTSAGDAMLDFVLYPGEIFIRRLLPQTAKWEAVDRESEDDLRAGARGGSMGKMSGALISYRTVFGIARVMAGGKVTAPGAAIDAACARLDGLLKRAMADQPPEMLVREAYEIGCTLLGVPMTRAELRVVTTPIGELVSAQGAASQFKRGALLASLGLAVLPGDPYLEVHLARMLRESGLLSDALECLERALCRSDALDPDTMALAQAEKAGVFCKLGRTTEARSIVAALVRDRPDDVNVVRVQRIVNEASAN